MLAAKMTMGDENSHLNQIKRYLKGTAPDGARPYPGTAWNLGDALFDVGVPWASGLWMIYACGYFSDFAGIIGKFLRLESVQGYVSERKADIRNDLWAMVSSVRHLTFTTVFDAIPKVVDLHRSERYDDKSIEAALEGSDLRLEPEEFARQQLRLVLRERAKAPWLKYAAYRDLFSEAFGEWSDTPELDALDIFGQSAIALGDDPSTFLWVKERDIRTLIGLQLQWALPTDPANLPLPTYLDMDSDIKLSTLVANGMVSPFADQDRDLIEEYLLLLQSCEILDNHVLD